MSKKTGGLKTLSVKPHHFIDILADFGNKDMLNPHEYGHAQHIAAKRIFAGQNVMLSIELGADYICAPCRHNINGICDDIIDTSFRPLAPKSKNEWNLLIDRRWCEDLNLKQGDRLTARQFCRMLRDKISDIPAIYRELPAALIAERQTRIQKGVNLFLRETVIAP